MSKTQSATHTTVTETNNTEIHTAHVPSIRCLVRGMLLEGKGTKEIAAQIAKFHPESAAAKKSAKHIAWYKATMKKAGELPTIGA